MLSPNSMGTSHNQHRVKLGFYLFVCLYVTLIHILTLYYFGETLATSERGRLFIYDFNSTKYLFCLIETVFFLFFLFSHFKRQSFPDICFVFLLLLYFIPGVVQQAATNSEWGYMFFFFMFWFVMEIWNIFFMGLKEKQDIMIIKRDHIEKWFTYLLVLSIIITLVLLVLYQKSFSIGYLILVMSDVYEIRANATSSNIHWIFTNLEYWAAYFSVIATSFFAARRKWWLVLVLIIVNLSIFILEAFRMFLFLEIIALFIGVFRIKINKIPFIFVIFALILFFEVSIFEKGLIITDIYRRFSLVPNRISEFYYDYFQTNEPDYLRIAYSRISASLGYPSPYEKDNIGHIISNYYIGVDGGMNNGLVGGGMFSFGYYSLMITTFGYTLVYYLFGKYVESLKDSNLLIIIAFFMVSLSANLPYFLATLISPSYLLLLLLTLIFICNNKESRIKIPINR